MEREIITIAQGKWCQGEHLALELATHSVTDAKQTADGWEETSPRYGCDKEGHRVTSNVILLDGTIVPFSEYRPPEEA